MNLLKLKCMSDKMKQRIKDFNKIPNQDNSKRIIIATLDTRSVTQASNSTK